MKCKLLLKIRALKTPQCDEINQIIENEFGFNVDVEFELLFVQELAAEFSKILASYKPKLVFLTVFYRPEAMAMSLACHRLGIRVVEYQHGAQNDHHVMYTHWENIPKKGYELIPDIFWMWGSIPMKRIMKWATGTTKHRAIVGGNLWMAYIQENKNNHGDMGEYFEKDKINILISLQGDQFFPTFLLESIKNNSSEIIWHFRDHPRLPISDELKNKILKLSNCEIEFSSQAYLYQLFKYINIHITGYSTVAFEAQSFHIPTIFTHINALNGYKDLMNQNGLFYADDLQCFNDLVNTLLSTEVKIEPNYIDSSHVTYNRTLSLLLE